MKESKRGADVPETSAEARSRVHDRMARTETEVHSSGSSKTGAIEAGPRGRAVRGHGGGGNREAPSGTGYKGGGRGRR